MTLTKDQRTRLALVVGRVRSAVETDVSEQATGRFGLHVSPRRGVHVESEEALDLGPSDLAIRRQLVEVVDYLRGEGASPGEAVGRLVREASFTLVNRLFAVRVAETIGVIPVSLADGTSSVGFREFAELFPAVVSDIEFGYWQYLQTCGDELAAAGPALFDRRHPVTAFRPRHKTLEGIISLLSHADLLPVWHEPETLGWTYQFFNSEDERRQMRADSSAPRNSRELAVRNQFFTPSYVVDWLLQNTLGRRLREAGYNIDLPLLEGESERSAPLDLQDVMVLDPAVGSGHFLLGAYEMLELLWSEQGLSTAEAAPRIIKALHGIDIDHRAAQVAQVVLVLRARRAGAVDVEPPTIVTARTMPRHHAVRERIVDPLSASVRDAVDELDDALANAPILGSLLQVEETLQESITSRFSIPFLGDERAHDIDAVERAVLTAASRLAAEAEASPAERLFAADASDAIRFVELIRRRYDVVLMNPPFGAPVPETKAYLKSAYGSSSTDLYSAFVHRGRDLLAPQGYLGAITNRTGFFLKTFAVWRSTTLIPGLVCAADLGLGVLQDALVEVATYVLSRNPTSDEVRVRSLLRVPDKAQLVYVGTGDSFVRERSTFRALPNSTLSYSIAPSIAEVFYKYKCLDNVGEARQGLATADDFRFVRLWWEVPPWNIGRNERWSPFAKGGEYAPWYADLHLVVDWENDGQRIKETGRGRPQNIDAYFRPGLTWSTRTASGFVVRALPEGSIFAHKGCYLAGEDNAALAAWANSRAVRYLIGLQLAAGETTLAYGAARSYEVGIIQKLPIPHTLPAQLSKIGHEQVAAVLRRAERDETDRHFLSWSDSSDSAQDLASRLVALGEVDRAVSESYGLDEEACRVIDEEIGPDVSSYPINMSIDEEELVQLYSLPLKRLVDHVLVTRGADRYIGMKSYLVDRRLELLCHLFRVHPAAVADVITRRGLQAPEEAGQRARALISYIVGLAFGRWDVRALGRQVPDASPWAPVDHIPPGMLVNGRGEPTRCAPPSYPLELPTTPILVDDPGHQWDIGHRVRLAAKAAFGSADRVDDAVRVLGDSSLESYLRGHFFTYHLEQYSRSRRRAPLYWQLGLPGTGWGLWLYYPDLSRESLFAVTHTAEEKLKTTQALIAQLSNTVHAGQRSRTIQERLERCESLRDRLLSFIDRARAVSQSGWEPDLSDGCALSAAPLADLFVHAGWREEIAEQRAQLINGEYPWATVQQTYFGNRS